MRALVLGGGGFIGRHVAPILYNLGHEAIIATRTDKGDVVDRSQPDAVARLVADERCQVLIDMIAYERDWTIALRKTLAGSIGRYVLVSSPDVLAGLDPRLPLALDTGRIREQVGFAEILPPGARPRSVLADEIGR